MACSCIYNKYDQQKRHYSPSYDLPLGSADSLKKSRRWFFQTSLAGSTDLDQAELSLRQHTHRNSSLKLGMRCSE